MDDIQFIAQQLMADYQQKIDAIKEVQQDEVPVTSKPLQKLSLSNYLAQKKDLQQLLSQGKSDQMDQSCDIESDKESCLFSDSDDEQVIVEEEGQIAIDPLLEDEDVDNTVPKTKNEVELPPVIPPPIQIIPIQYMIYPVGQIIAVVEDTVVVQSRPVDLIAGNLTLDEGSILAFSDRHVLGLIFDTFGSIKQPMYSVRFNSAADIDQVRCQIGEVIYSCPDYIRPVFTEQLKAIKGSDASNIYDEEVGEDEFEFSDDEKEQMFKSMRKKNKKQSRSQIDNRMSDLQYVQQMSDM